MLTGVGVLGNIEADTGPVPWHFEGAGTVLDRFDDLVGDGLMDIELWFEGIVFCHCEAPFAVGVRPVGPQLRKETRTQRMAAHVPLPTDVREFSGVGGRCLVAAFLRARVCTLACGGGVWLCTRYRLICWRLGCPFGFKTD